MGSVSGQRLGRAAAVTVAVGLVLTFVWSMVYDWMINERNLFCTYSDQPEGAVLGCPDGVAYIIPGALGAAGCFALAFVVGVLVSHVRADGTTRLGNGTWMVDAAAVLLLVHGGLLLAGNLPWLPSAASGPRFGNVDGLVAAVMIGAAEIVTGVVLRRSRRTWRAITRAGCAALAGLVLLALCLLTYQLWVVTAWLVLPAGMLAGAFMFGGAALMLSGRNASR